MGRETTRQRDTRTEGQRDRGTETQRDRGTGGQRDRGTGRQRDRETERQRDKETEGQRDRETEGQRDREIQGQRDRGTEETRKTEKQRDRGAERQRDKETERQRDREIEGQRDRGNMWKPKRCPHGRGGSQLPPRARLEAITEAIDNGDDRFTQLIRMLNHFTVASSDGFRIFAKFSEKWRENLSGGHRYASGARKSPGFHFPAFPFDFY